MAALKAEANTSRNDAEAVPHRSGGKNKDHNKGIMTMRTNNSNAQWPGDSRNGNPDPNRISALHSTTADLIKVIRDALSPTAIANNAKTTDQARATDAVTNLNKVRITIMKTRENGSADAPRGADKENMAGRTSAAGRGDNMAASSAEASNGDISHMGISPAIKASAGTKDHMETSPAIVTKNPAISAVLTVRLAIVPVLKRVTRAMTTADHKAARAGAARSSSKTTTRKALALLPIAVVLTVKKTNSMMKTMTRITVALHQDMVNRAVAASSRGPIEIGEVLLARIS